jgi:hypothetical protein
MPRPGGCEVHLQSEDTYLTSDLTHPIAIVTGPSSVNQLELQQSVRILSHTLSQTRDLFQTEISLCQSKLLSYYIQTK